MPPGVTKAGVGPVVPQAPAEVEEVKSSESEKKSVEQQAETSKNDAPQPYRASSQEASHRKAELSTQAAAQQAALNDKLDRKAGKSEKAATTVKPEYRKPSANQSKGNAWGFVKDAARLASNAAGAGVAALRETTTNAAAVHLAERANAEVMQGLNNASNYSTRKQGVEQLAQRKYPQDMVPGQMFEVEKIREAFGEHRGTYTERHTEVVWAPPGTMKLGGQEQDVGPSVPKGVDHPQQYRRATRAELEGRLKELNGGEPLTDFEKKLTLEFKNESVWSAKREKEVAAGRLTDSEKKILLSERNERDPRLSQLSEITPIKGLEAKGEKIDKEVQAYKVETVYQGLRTYTYYDRNGNVLRDKQSIAEAPVTEGIAPWEVVGIAQLGKHVVTKGAKIGKNLVAKEAGTTVKAETGAVARSAQQQAVKAENSAAARTGEQQAATLKQNSGEVTTHQTSWRQGSGTSVHTKPSGSATKPTVSEFTQVEKNEIKSLESAGYSRREAEQIVRDAREVEWVPQGLNAGGTTRSAYKNPGAGKKTP